MRCTTHGSVPSVLSLLGSVSSYLLQGDRTLPVRVLVDPNAQQRIETLPFRSASGATVTLRDVATIDYEPGILEMHREDLRQLVAVSARLSEVDMGRGVRAIQAKLADSVQIPPEAIIEYGGLYQQQQESFRNLTLVLVMATVLVFTVLLFEFRTLLEPLAIIIGALLALVGVAAALWLTGTSLNIVSFLGLLPLAYGVGAGADMLRPLAIGVIGALFVSLALSLIATPVCYFLLSRLFAPGRLGPAAPVPHAQGGATP